MDMHQPMQVFNSLCGPREGGSNKMTPEDLRFCVFSDQNSDSPSFFPKTL